MTYDFKGLTDLHKWLIVYQGWSVGQKYPDGSLWPQPSPRQNMRLSELSTYAFGVKAYMLTTPFLVTAYKSQRSSL